MSGILDKKQRLIDFVLTTDGYRQIENGDLRIIYASLTDREAIYDRKVGEYNISDIDTMPFFLEASSNFFDKINIEIDLKQNSNFEIRTDLNNQYIDLRNNEYKNISNYEVNAEYIFNKVATSLSDNLKSQHILLTDYSNSNLTINGSIDLYINKINDQIIDFSSLIQDQSLIEIKINNLINYPTILNANSLNLSRKSMIEDDRFQNKLNYLFLPPSNMNTEIVTLNNKINGFYNLGEDKRDIHKILFKNFIINRFDFTNKSKLFNFQNLIGDYEEILNASINFLEEMSSLTINSSIAKIEFDFETVDVESDFILNLTELQTFSENNVSFNKLLFINHGEIKDQITNLSRQVYSVGKLYSSKTEIDFDNIPSNNLANGGYIIEDNYLFINLFTIVIE